MDSLCICYNLASQKYPGIPVLPEAYIVPLLNNELGYVEKQATPIILDSFEIPYLETPHVELLDICASLKPAVLEQKFRPAKKRKNFGLTEIMQEPLVKDVVAKYINTKMTAFYQIIVTNQYPITYHAQRKDPFQVQRLTISKKKLDPILEFTKTEEGIDYAFSLKDEDTVIKPHLCDIQILLNDPSYIVMDQSIYQILNLNANKLKPFFNKEKINIATKHIKTYLDKVIIPVIKNVDVSAKGFDIISNQHIHTYGIEVVEDFINGNFIIKAFFNYDEAYFDYNSKKTISSTVHYDESGEIKVIQTKRNTETEKEILSQLEAKGLIINDNLFLELKESTDSLGIFNWVQQYHKQLEKEGFEVILPDFDNRDVNTDPHKIDIKNKKKMTGSISKES